MTITIKECKQGNVLIAMEQNEYGIYHVAAFQNHDGELYGYPIAENYTCRKDTANSYYYYLRRRYK